MAGSETVFRQAAIKSKLLSKKDLEEAVQAIYAEDSSQADTAVEITDEKLAEQLVEMGHLNLWQSEQLRQGKTKFTLRDYNIIDSIGSGGMGEVYKAEHSVMGRVVAIKVLPKNRSTDDAVANFHREIRTLANLDHPNLVRAYDAGHDGKVHFLVTEFVPGTDMRDLVRQGGRMQEQDAATLVRDVARGLGHAHQCGLVHRDVKPGNIMVTPEGMVKVLDLGLAGFLQEELELHGSMEKDPNKGRIVGTADFLAPEVIKGNPATAASDIYSLGITLYYMLTKYPPFHGGSTMEKCRRHLDEQPPDPRKPPLNAKVSADFLHVLSAMMAKDPEKRIQTAAEVIDRVAPFCGGNFSPSIFSQTASVGGSGAQSDTDRFRSESQVTIPVATSRNKKKSRKSVWRPIIDWVGAMSQGQFNFLVTGLALLVSSLLILLLLLVF